MTFARVGRSTKSPSSFSAESTSFMSRATTTSASATNALRRSISFDNDPACRLHVSPKRTRLRTPRYSIRAGTMKSGRWDPSFDELIDEIEQSTAPSSSAWSLLLESTPTSACVPKLDERRSSSTFIRDAMTDGVHLLGRPMIYQDLRGWTNYYHASRVVKRTPKKIVKTTNPSSRPAKNLK